MLARAVEGKDVTDIKDADPKMIECLAHPEETSLVGAPRTALALKRNKAAAPRSATGMPCIQARTGFPLIMINA